MASVQKLVCDECALLVAEYNESTRAYQRAVAQYRVSLSGGISDELEATKAALARAQTDVRCAREAFQKHRTVHSPIPYFA